MGGIRDMVLAAAVGFLGAALGGLFLLPLLRSLRFGQGEEDLSRGKPKGLEEAPPAGGGILLLCAMVVGVLLCGGEGMGASLPCLLFALAFGSVGFLDEGLRIYKKKKEQGLLPWQKGMLELALSIGAALWLYFNKGSVICLPFSGRAWDMGFFFLPFAVLILLGTVKGACSMEGPQGLLCSMGCMQFLTCGLLFGLMTAGTELTEWGPDTANLNGMAAFCGAAAGGCLGFLLFNCPPAKGRMGEAGALALGSALAMGALVSGQGLLLLLMGIGYVLSLLSMLVQWIYGKKHKGKAFFKAIPFHRHLLACGVPEGRLISLYGILTAAACIFSLLTYLL